MFFGKVRQKAFAEKSWYPFLCSIFFETPKFLTHWRAPHEVFRHCETKEIRKKIVMSPAFLFTIFFTYQKFFETQKWSLKKFFGTEDKKFLTESDHTPTHLSNFCSIPEVFWNTEGFRYEIFRDCQKRFLWKNVIARLLLFTNFFPYHKFSEQQKGPLTKLFVSVLWDIKFSTKPWCPFSFAWKYRYQNIFETQKGSTTNIFRYCETKIFWAK